MSDANAIELAASERLDTWLRAHVDGFAGPLTMQKFEGGQSNPTYKLITPTRAFVMRSKPGPVAKLLPSAHAIEREYRIMAALASTGVPVAPVHGLCEDETVIGRAFFIMDFIPGRILWQQSIPEVGRPERSAIYDEMNRVIAVLHSVDWDKLGLADYGRPGNYFARQIARWSKQYQASEMEKVEAMDRLIAWLPQHVPPGDETVIVHGDYRLDNVILDNVQPRIRAVLDWELSTLGHPLADFSYHCLSWHVVPERFRGVAGLDLAALGIPSEQDYVRRYCERMGRDPDGVLEHWDFYIAYNLFRLAAILQGVAKRAAQGVASGRSAHEYGARVRPLAEKGWAIARAAAD